VAASFLNSVPLVRQVYATTYPWSLPYRHLTFAAVVLAVIGGGGFVYAGEMWGRLLGRLVGRPRLRRRVVRVGHVLVATWLVLTVWAVTVFLAIPRGLLGGFVADDAAAMEWLRAHVPPGYGGGQRHVR
jgi:hypothetical protein